MRFSQRDLRLGSGLVLFAYLTAHLLNHSLGLVSLDAAETGLRVAVAVWHSLPGTVLLYGAVAVHVALALAAITARRTWRMPWIDAVRIAAGLSMPVILISHFAETRLAAEWSQSPAVYGRVVSNLARETGLQLALLAPGWLHGCLGIYRAYSGRAGFARVRQVLFALAILLPTLSACGYLAMARESAQREAARPGWLAEQPPRPDAVRQQRQRSARDEGRAGWYLLVVAVILLPFARHGVERQRGRLVNIRYPGGRTVAVPRGWTVLDASRAHRIRHLAACGGRARCTTCRVRVLDSQAPLPPPGADEARALARVGAAPDIRLACQLRPQGDLEVVPAYRSEPGRARAAWSSGEHRRVAVVMIGPRQAGTTGLRLLPDDLLFLIDRLVTETEAVIAARGGVSLGYAGGVVTGLFGLHGAFEDACREALRAAHDLEDRLVGDAAPRLTADFGIENRLLVVADAGPTVIGHGRAPVAIGGCVDAARTWAATLPLAPDERFVVSARLLGLSDGAAEPAEQAVPVRWLDVDTVGGATPQPDAASPLPGAPRRFERVAVLRSLAPLAALATSATADTPIQPPDSIGGAALSTSS